MLKLGNMFRHTFSQLKDTLSCLNIKTSLSWVRGHLASPCWGWGENPKRGGNLPFPWAQLPSGCPLSVIISCKRGGTKLFELWQWSGRGGTSNSREVSPLLSPTKRDGAWPRRGGTTLRGELSLLQEPHLLPLFYINQISSHCKGWKNIVRILY